MSLSRIAWWAGEKTAEAAFAATLLLLGARMAGLINWAWVWVLSPVWIWEVAALVALLLHKIWKASNE